MSAAMEAHVQHEAGQAEDQGEELGGPIPIEVLQVESSWKSVYVYKRQFQHPYFIKVPLFYSWYHLSLTSSTCPSFPLDI
jgi:hypothetical protein